MSFKNYALGTNPAILADALASVGSSGVIILGYVSVLPASASNYQTLQKLNTAGAGPTGYQVTTGKVLYIAKMLFLNQTAAHGINEIGFGDNAVNNSGSAPTNSVALISGIDLGATIVRTPTLMDLGFLPVRDQKFPYLRANSTGGSFNALFLCFEE